MLNDAEISNLKNEYVFVLEPEQYMLFDFSLWCYV